MGRKYIAAGWDSYRETVVPQDAGAVQLNETRQAFFAGAAILLLALDPSPTPTEADLQVMTDLQAELDAFGLELDLRLLRPQGRG